MSHDPIQPPPAPRGLSGLPVLLGLLVLGLSASVVFFRWAAHDVSEGVIGELAARPSDPAGQLDHWLVYGEPQIQHRLAGLRYSSALPALVTHVTAPPAPGEPSAVHGIDLSASHPARVVREDLRIEVRLGAPQLLADGPLTGEAAHRVPRATAGVGPAAGRAFAQGVFEWALEPLARALPGDIAGASLVVLIEDEPFGPPGAVVARSTRSWGEPRRKHAPLILGATVLLLAIAVGFALRRGRRDHDVAHSAP